MEKIVQKTNEKANEKTICQVIETIKETNEGWELLFQYLKPLVRGYCKKLFFLEEDDAKQEICISIVIAVQKMTRCQSDGECLTYIEHAVSYTYCSLCRKHSKELPTTSLEENDSSLTEQKSCSPENDVDYYLDLRGFVKKLKPMKKRIMMYILEGYSDNETAFQLKVSRQYVNKVKHEFFPER